MLEYQPSPEDYVEHPHSTGGEGDDDGDDVYHHPQGPTPTPRGKSGSSGECCICAWFDGSSI